MNASSIETITLAPNAQSIRLGCRDGETLEISAQVLRSNARDAQSRRELIDNGCIVVKNNIQITDIKSMSTTGLNIQFSDGHKQAIFPIDYLIDLAEQPRLDDNRLINNLIDN